MSRYSAEDLLGLVQAEIATVLTYTAVTARHYELSLSEISALEYLEQAGELTPSQLGTKLTLSSGAITALVDRLEKAGYVQRKPHPRDRRSSLVRPTGTGGDEVRRQQAELALKIRTLNEELSQPEREVVGHYLEKLTAVISQYTQPFIKKEK